MSDKDAREEAIMKIARKHLRHWEALLCPKSDLENTVIAAIEEAIKLAAESQRTQAPSTPVSTEEHTCNTPNYTDGPCYACAREKVLEWIFERYESCIRIAGQKTGDDKRGWMEDADHFMFVLTLLKQPSRTQAPSELREKAFEISMEANLKNINERHLRQFHGGYCVTIPNFEGGKVVRLEDAEAYAKSLAGTQAQAAQSRISVLEDALRRVHDDHTRSLSSGTGKITKCGCSVCELIFVAPVAALEGKP